MADEKNINIGVKIQQTDVSGASASSRVAERFQDRKYFANIEKATTEFQKLATTLVILNRTMHHFQNAIKLIPDIAQYAALKAGLNMGVNMASGAIEMGSYGMKIGKRLGPKGALIGGLIGAGLGAAQGYAQTDQAQKEMERKQTELQKEQRRQQEKRRAEYLFEGQFTDFKGMNDRKQQIALLKEWVSQRDALREEERKARQDLKEGGSVEQYERVNNALEKMEGLVQQAAGVLDTNAKKSVPETKLVNFMDNMSRMGLYMSGGYANAGGGSVEVQIMKEQKDILKKIERNTENTAASYS